MIIVEASHINTGGSFNLLKYLLQSIDEKRLPAIVYIKYKHIYQELKDIGYKYIEIKQTTTIKTIYRFCLFRQNVFYFCSLPPFVHNKNSYVYFHSEYYSLKPQTNMRFKTKKENIKSFLYYFIIRLFKNNVSSFLCQTHRIAKQLKITYNLNAVVAPFYELPNVRKQATIPLYDFIYPAIASAHKNHERLFQAVNIVANTKKIKLAVTIANSNTRLINMINEINQQYGLTIFNQGVITKSEVVDLYSKSKALIFPSLVESLGLPLIEAAQSNIMVLCSDLDFAYNAISNPIVFNPYDVNDIAEKMQFFLMDKYMNVAQNVILKNEIDQIIDLFNNNGI